MQRRTLLKNISILSSGMIFFPACDFSPNKENSVTQNSAPTITDPGQTLLKELVTSIIPDMPDMKLEAFVHLMVQDCLKREEQIRFRNGQQQLDPYAIKHYQEPFGNMPSEKRITFLEEVMDQKALAPREQVPAVVPVKYHLVGPSEMDLNEIQPQEIFTEEVLGNREGAEPEAFLKEIQFFINTTKSFAIQGFLTSEYVMTKVMPYTLVPATYQYCETIDPSKRINIHA